MGKKTKAAPKRDLGWALCLSTDGEVLVARTTPDFERYLPTWSEPPQAPFTMDQAVAIRDAICDHYPKEQGPDPAEPGRWLFRSDPRTQMDLSHKFREAIKREAAKL